jgi:hypothetical protein
MGSKSGEILIYYLDEPLLIDPVTGLRAADG